MPSFPLKGIEPLAERSQIHGTGNNLPVLSHHEYQRFQSSQSFRICLQNEKEAYLKSTRNELKGSEESRYGW